MKASRKDPFVLTAMAAALLLAFAPTISQADEITELTKPYSTIDLGAGYVNKDNQRFGEYTGLTDKGGYGIVDFSLIKRDDATGTWFKLQGRDLGFKDPELRLEQKRQGDWGYYVDYSRIPRYTPFTINTGLQGLGTTSQTQVTVPVGGGTDYQIHTKRDRWTIGMEKAFNQWDVKVRYRNDQKDGSWLWGRPGYFFGAGSTPTFLAKPIDYTIQQIDASAEYDTERYQIRAGYYGSMFDNKNGKVDVSPVIANNFTEFGLPPDNQAHQFYVTGGYNLTATTHGDFKVSYARETQNDTWSIAPPAGVTQTSLDARVDTTLVQAGVSGRATPKLDWRADVRYQNRDDKTPVVVYAGGVNSYKPRSLERTTLKGVGHYSLPMGFRLTGDITYDQKKREVPEETAVGFREKVKEATYRVELRRAVSPTLTGAVSLAHSKRDGSEWLDNLLTPSPTYNIIAPIYMADRDRNTVRLVVNWMPSDPFSLNFRVDESRDDYTGRNNETNGLDVGPRKGRASNYSLDAAYVFSERVTGTAWLSHGDNRISNATCDEYPGAPPPAAGGTCQPTADAWAADVKNVADNFGLGLRAKATSKVDFGADVTYAKVRDQFDLTPLNAQAAADIIPLPDITTKVTTLKLYGTYRLDRLSGVRLDYVYDQYQTDDWTWANWNYGDGTTVLQNPNQKVNFVGVSYYYKFQ